MNRKLHQPRQAKLALARAVLLLPLVALIAGCSSEAKVSQDRQDIARPVKVTVVGEAVYGRTLSYSGVVRPRIESAVGFRVAGKIVERLVNAGDRVEVGQVIARLDDIDLRLAENSARAAVDAARSRRDIARDNLERGKALLPQATISQAAYDTRRNEMDAAAAALESAEAQLRQASNATGYVAAVCAPDLIDPVAVNLLRTELQLEALAHHAGKKAAHRMLLPARGLHHRGNRGACTRLQHCDEASLLRAGIGAPAS